MLANKERLLDVSFFCLSIEPNLLLLLLAAATKDNKRNETFSYILQGFSRIISFPIVRPIEKREMSEMEPEYLVRTANRCRA